MIHTKRYLAAAGDNYYPTSDFGDVYGAFDTVEEAISAGKELARDPDWISVYDLLTGKLVASQYHVFDFGDGHKWHVRPVE